MQCSAMPCHKYNGLFVALHRYIFFVANWTHSLHFIPILLVLSPSHSFYLSLLRWVSRLVVEHFYFSVDAQTFLHHFHSLYVPVDVCSNTTCERKKYKARRAAREFIIGANECAHFLSNRTNIQKPTSTTDQPTHTLTKKDRENALFFRLLSDFSFRLMFQNHRVSFL